MPAMHDITEVIAATTCRYPLRALIFESASGVYLTTAIVGSIGWYLQGGTVQQWTLTLTFTNIIVALVATLGAAILQEGVQALVFHWYGYAVVFYIDWRRLVAYTGTYDVLHAGRPALTCTLAPLLVLPLFVTPYNVPLCQDRESGTSKVHGLLSEN